MARSDNVVIFDFDGTLADVAEVLRELYNEEAVKRGWPNLTEKDFKRLRKGTLKDAMKWVGVRSWQVPGLLRVGRRKFGQKSQNVKIFPGISKMLNQLERDGWKIFVLSANSVETIHRVLEKNGVDQHVHVLKRSPIFGKWLSIKRLIKKKDYQPQKTWMVGDEVRDLEAASKAGVKSIAVTWGLQDESVLRKNSPTFVTKIPDEIVSILKDSIEEKDAR